MLPFCRAKYRTFVPLDLSDKHFPFIHFRIGNKIHQNLYKPCDDTSRKAEIRFVAKLNLAVFLLGFSFDPEGGGYIFLRNVG
jgi:hypothetical protein